MKKLNGCVPFNKEIDFVGKFVLTYYDRENHSNSKLDSIIEEGHLIFDKIYENCCAKYEELIEDYE
jgi:hypothetical protein